MRIRMCILNEEGTMDPRRSRKEKNNLWYKVKGGRKIVSEGSKRKREMGDGNNVESLHSIVCFIQLSVQKTRHMGGSQVIDL